MIQLLTLSLCDGCEAIVVAFCFLPVKGNGFDIMESKLWWIDCYIQPLIPQQERRAVVSDSGKAVWLYSGANNCNCGMRGCFFKVLSRVFALTEVTSTSAFLLSFICRFVFPDNLDRFNLLQLTHSLDSNVTCYFEVLIGSHNTVGRRTVFSARTCGKHPRCHATVKDSHVVIHELLIAAPVQQAMAFWPWHIILSL